MTRGGPDHQGSLPGPTTEEAARLAREHGLQKVGVRPPLGRYVRDIWRNRQFLVSLSQGQFVAAHQNNYLGLVWAVLNPILLGFAYYLIFGVLLGTRGTLENYVGFLTIGLFAFVFVSAGFNYGSRSLIDNTSLVRSLRFPRALLPISVSLTHLFSNIPAFLILLVIALITGETPSWEWLLFVPALVVLALITTGMALLSAPLVHAVRDAVNLIPLLTRMLRYISGIFFPIMDYATGIWQLVLAYQPIAVALTLVREPLLGELPVRWETWAVAGGWAVLLLGAGLVVFWRGEAGYGRA